MRAYQELSEQHLVIEPIIVPTLLLFKAFHYVVTLFFGLFGISITHKQSLAATLT